MPDTDAIQRKRRSWWLLHQRKREEEKDWATIIEKKVLAKAKRAMCPSERKAQAKMELSRQEKRQQKDQQKSPTETRAKKLE